MREDVGNAGLCNAGRLERNGKGLSQLPARLTCVVSLGEALGAGIHARIARRVALGSRGTASADALGSRNGGLAARGRGGVAFVRAERNDVRLRELVDAAGE